MFYTVFPKLNLAVVMVTFLAILYSFPGFFRRVYSRLSSFDVRYVVVIFLVFVSGFFVRGFVFENTHSQFLDEFYYMDEAKNFLETGRMERSFNRIDQDNPIYRPYLDGAGFPFLVSLVFLFFGVDSMAPVWLNVFLGSFSVLLVGFLGMNMFDERVGLLSSVLMVFFGYHIQWSSIADKTMSATFFALLFLNAAYMLYQEDGIKLKIFALATYMYSGLIRIELFVFLFPVLLIVFKDFVRHYLLPPYDTWRKRFSLIFSIFLSFVAFLNLYGKFFLLGTGGSRNVFLINFHGLYDNLVRLFSRPVDFAILFSVMFLLYWSLRDRELSDVRSIFLYTAVLYYLCFLFFGGFTVRLIIYPFSVGMVYISEGFFTVWDERDISGYLSLLLVIFIGLSMGYHAFNVDMEEYRFKDMKEDIEESFGGCYVFSKWSNLFLFSEDVYGVSILGMFDDEELMMSTFRNNCTLYFGEYTEFSEGIDNDVLKVYEKYGGRFYVFNITVDGKVGYESFERENWID